MESLTLNGGGAFAGPAFDSNFSSSFATAQTANLAGTPFSGAQTLLLADGASVPTAATLSTNYCSFLSFSTAMQSAFAAADSASQYITVMSYGAGARPVINANSLTNSGIEIAPRNGGGYKLINLEIKNALAAGVHFEAATYADGLWIENCNIHDIDGMLMPTPPGTAAQVPSYSNAWSAGICTKFLNRLIIKNTTITSTGVPYMIFESGYHYIENCTITQSRYEGAWHLNVNVGKSCKNGLIRNTLFDHMATLTWPTGTASVQLAGTSNIVFQACEISNTTASGDGVAIDLEQICAASGILNCNLHDNAGAAILDFVGTTTSGTIIADNICNNNGLSDANFPALIRCDATPSDTIVWLRNTITRRVTPAQFLFAATSHGAPNPTNTPNANWFYGVDNVG